MKNRQYSLKVFETKVEDEEKFIEFFETNYLLFKDHLIHIKGEMSDRICKYLEAKELKFIQDHILPAGRSRKALEEEYTLHTKKSVQPVSDHSHDEENKALKEELEALRMESGVNLQMAESQVKYLESEINKLTNKLQNNFMVLDTIIRSGRELKVEGDLLLLNRVNSGATIHTTGNMIITQVVEGALRCDGNFMMMTVSPKANIIFNGVEVDNSLLEDTLNRIELKNNEIYITPVIKKEINWA